MITAAVICEYNPLHTGHLYQIEQIREKLGADRIICLMSGDFVERGEPAILSKQIRAKMAVDCGADLVLLLPIVYACSAADVFAYGAVSILNKLGVVDYLCFGAESDSLDELIHLSDKLSNLNIDSEEIRALLREGKTYAQARAALLPEFSDLLSGSNNILALEYLNALKSTHSEIKPYLIKREGAEYNKEDISSSQTFQSATAIRNSLRNCLWEASRYIPEKASAYMMQSDLVFPNDYDSVILYSLVSKDKLSQYHEVSEDLSLRIKNELINYNGFEAFAEKIKTKNYTRARINRALIHILLNIKGSNSEIKATANALSHVRVLAFKNDSSDILRAVKEKNGISLVTKVPDSYDDMSQETKAVFDLELEASTLYDLILSCKSGNVAVPEYSKPIYIQK